MVNQQYIDINLNPVIQVTYPHLQIVIHNPLLVKQANACRHIL